MTENDWERIIVSIPQAEFSQRKFSKGYLEEKESLVSIPQAEFSQRKEEKK